MRRTRNKRVEEEQQKFSFAQTVLYPHLQQEKPAIVIISKESDIPIQERNKLFYDINMKKLPVIAILLEIISW